MAVDKVLFTKRLADGSTLQVRPQAPGSLTLMAWLNSQPGNLFTAPLNTGSGIYLLPFSPFESFPLSKYEYYELCQALDQYRQELRQNQSLL